jgi:hypothetical protein
MMGLVDILIRPRRAILRIDKDPRWIGAFAVLAALSMLLFALQYEQSSRDVLSHLPATADAADHESVAEAFRMEFWRNLLALPFRLLLGWSAFAFALTISARALSSKGGGRYLKVLALEVHGEAILLVSAALRSIHLPNPSLAMLVASPQSLLLDSLLTSGNFFTLWYLLVLAAGITVLCNVRYRSGLVLVSVVWALAQLLNIGALTLLAAAFHFQA